MKMSMAAMDRLKKSEFFHEVESVISAWDYYFRHGETEQADEMMYKWSMAKLALKHITGNYYGFSRKIENGKSIYGLVNEKDYSDWLIKEKPIEG